jgi:sortase A
VPIVDLPIVDRQWDVSGLGYYIGWLEGTTWMDPDWGNTVLAAHVQLGTNNPGPFWGLSTLEPGDEIIVIEGNTQRRFVVTDKKAVDPSDWTVTAPTDKPTLTLITCTNWDNNYGVFSERMIVRAVPEMASSQSG